MFGKPSRLSGFIFTLSLLDHFAAHVYADAGPNGKLISIKRRYGSMNFYGK